MAFITYLDENEFNKKQKALKRYFMKNYKYLIFEIIPTLRKENKKEGKYEIELPTDELFKKVYGPMKLLFFVKNDVAIMEDIIPSEILQACFLRDVPTYKGIPYDTNKDLKKIKMMEKILCQKKS